MSDTIRELRERKAKLIEELNLIDQYLQLHTRLFPGENAVNKSGSDETTPRRLSEEEKNDPRAVADRAEEVLREVGRPLRRGELVSRIEASGLAIYSKDKNKYLGTILWRHKDRFTNIADVGYWIRGLDIEMPPSELPLDS